MPEPYTDITQHRLKALNDFALSTAATKVILWLYNRSRGLDELLLSYAVGYSLEELERMRNLSVTFIASWKSDLTSTTVLHEDAEISLRIELEAAGLNEAELHLQPLVSSSLLGERHDNLIGVAFFNSLPSSVDSKNLNLASLLLAERIEFLRLSRLRNAAIGVQSAFHDKSTKTDVTLQSIANRLKLELGADHCTFINQNTDTNRQSALQSANLRKEIAQSDIHQHVSEKTFAISQDSVVLAPRRFTPGHELPDSLETLQTSELCFKFTGKTRNGYLQSCFSDTDLMVASHVFGYIEPYAAARIFDENYQIIHSKLRSIELKEASLPLDIQSLCRELSVSFRNTFLVIADYAEEDVRLEVMAANLSSSLSGTYLKRLKENYLSKWTSEPLQNLVMRAGVDISEERTLLEFHLPGDGRRSHVYLLEYERPTITQSILRSIVIFFNEMHNRFKKQEQHSDTLSYLTQVRHAVIHHFSAASDGMASLRPLWERGRRSKVYWDTLFSNPVMGEQIGKSVWSLGQAQLLIDNGRFLLGELDRLNRKNYQISSTIDNCFRTLNSQRLTRGLVVKGVSRGAQPSIMNADEPILRVAIMNIVDNAFKYSQVGSTVVWELDYGQEGYRLSITNAGAPIGERQFRQYLKVGIRGSQRDHLNQRHGTGLGLPVANKILLAHAPQARLQLSPEKRHPSIEGSTNSFFFDMPYLTGQSHRSDPEVNE